MPRDGSGNYNLPSGNPVVPNTIISSSGWGNPTMSDIGSALTASITRDGQTVPTANLPMGNFRHTGVANASNRTDYAAAGQVQDSSLQWLTSVSGTDTITANVVPSFAAYTAGQTFRFLSVGANTTTTVTLNINGLGAVPLHKNGSANLNPGDIPSATIIVVTYDGSAFQVGMSAAQIGFTQFGTGAVTRSVQAKLQESVSALDYRFLVTNTAVQNLAALKVAIAAVPVGAKLIVPADPGGGTYLIDATGGLSNAAVINKSMTLQIDGVIKSIGHTQQTNPMYPIQITGNDVFVTGNGTIQGDGTFDTSNTGDETTFPGLLYVTGNNFTCFGPTILQNPKVGILLANCNNAVICGCKFTGGPSSYVTGNTAYFGVRTLNGSGHSISGNRSYPDGGGGVPIDLVFGLNTTNMLIANNNTTSLWEKLCYLYCTNCVVANNIVNYPSGNQTDAIRITGSNNKVTGNWTINSNGGVTAYDGFGNQITNNQFLQCKQTAIYVTRLSGTYTNGFNDTVIADNMCSAGTGGALVDGISVISVGSDSYRIRVQNNTVIGFAPTAGNAQIRIGAASPNALYDSVVSGNELNGNATGQALIMLSRCVRAKISNNPGASPISTGVGIGLDGCDRIDISEHMLYNPGAWAFDLKYNGVGTASQSTDVRVLNNQSRGATNNGINNIGTTFNNYGRGNQYTDQPLIGSVTLSAATSTNVSHGGVASNAAIFLQEINASAGTMATVKGRCYTAPNGVNFTIAVANATSAAGTEQFAYEIIQ